MSSKKVINSIQFLRGFAAFVVVFYHIGGYIKKNFPVSFLGDFFGFGFAGVDLFFVISGFIIHFTSKQYLDQPAYFTEYLKKRFLRVFPIYWVVMTGLFLLGWLISNVLNKDVFSTAYPHTFSAYFQTYFLVPFHFAINPVTWTLSFELFFYLCFSLLILSKRLWFIPVAILLGSIINMIVGNNFDSRYFNFVFSSYNLEFFFGFLICGYYERFKLNNIVSIFILIFALIIIVSLGFEISDYDYWKRVLVFGFPSGLILIALLNLEANKAIIIPKFTILLGDASYVLYLIHFPMLLLLNKIPSIIGSTLSVNQTVYYNYLIGIMIILASIVMHKMIEKPLSKYLMNLSK
ncbi:acyltransferase [Arcicella aquatica]|uniref:Acyltransferase n=1 Tax=Arcicella aquatica TaxID=217141 RepID=A0ABU5QPG5_9BACT|nr:acyltransferase [Arcicella aquatica]MEA5258958.1 acyltransferase [Arcicella aquatica]